MQKEALLEALRRLSPAERREILAQFLDDTAGSGRSRVFLSYSRDDTHFVRDLMVGLERGGVHVWFDVRELMVGENYLIATEKGLRECDYCLVVVSPQSMKSAEVARELAIARTTGTTILPVILQDAVVTDSLGNLQWVDFRFDFDEPLDALVARLHGREAPGLTAQRLRSATWRLGGTGGFVPLFHRAMPPSSVWCCCLLLATALSISLSGLALAKIVPLWLPVPLFYGALLLVHAFRVAGRRDTLGTLRGTMWATFVAIPFLTVPFTAILDPKPRYWVWGCAAFAMLSILGAILLVEFSKDFRRRLPARLEKVEFIPAWLRRRKPAVVQPVPP